MKEYETKITLDIIKQAAEWAQGATEGQKPIDGEVRQYEQSTWDCGTSCCMWGAASLISGSGKATSGPTPEWAAQSLKHTLIAGILNSGTTSPSQVLTVIDADLSDADLRGADLRGADLSGANLRGASLSGASLSDADLSHANLSHADLSHANLSDANLSGANLSHVNLSHVNLSDADLSDADLRGASLSHANLSDAKVTIGNVTREIK